MKKYYDNSHIEKNNHELLQDVNLPLGLIIL